MPRTGDDDDDDDDGGNDDDDDEGKKRAMRKLRAANEADRYYSIPTPSSSLNGCPCQPNLPIPPMPTRIDFYPFYLYKTYKAESLRYF